MFASSALLLGRVTYRGFAKAWPNMKGYGDFGDLMNCIPKYVVSPALSVAEAIASLLPAAVTPFLDSPDAGQG